MHAAPPLSPARRRLVRAIGVGAVALSVGLSAAGCSWTENDTKVATYGLPDLTQSLMAETWLLDASASSVQPVTDAPVTLQFDEDGFSGVAQCNSYGGSYEVGEGSITIGAVGGTLRACVEQDLMDAEAAYLKALEGPHDVDVTDRDRLVLEHDGTRLEYTVADRRIPTDGSG